MPADLRIGQGSMNRTVFRGGAVVDGSGGPVGHADVVVEGDRIVDVGLDLDADEAVDCTGKTVLPGLFDCHVHLTISTLDYLELMRAPFSAQYFTAVENLRTLLGIGITSVRDACGADLGVKQAVERGVVPGPRTQISITMISQTGGHGDSWSPCGFDLPVMPPHPGRPAGVVDGPDAMRRTVRELVRAGADVIKVATSGGVMSPNDDPRHRHFGDDELDVLVAEAAAAGRWVMSHAQGADGVRAAVRAGVRSIEHGFYLDDEVIELMVDRGTWLVPTLSMPLGILAASKAGNAVSDASLRKIEEAIEAHRLSFAKAVSAGVRVAMGSDAPLSPFGSNLVEVQLMEQLSGMTAIDAWAAATSSAARLLGVDAELGELQPGKRADVVVLDGEPTDLDGLAARISQVWKDGRRVV